MDWLHNLRASIAGATGLSGPAQAKIVYTILALALAPVVSRLILAVVRRVIHPNAIAYRTQVAVRYVVSGFVVMMLAMIWFTGFKQLGTFLGIASAGLLIALQDSVANLAGFIFVIWRKPFKLGDRIEIDGVRGDVIDIRMFQFSVAEIGNWVDADQSTGRIAHIPNARVLKEPVINSTQGFSYIWHEVAVLVTFESNWRLAKELLGQIAAEHFGELSPEAQAEIRHTAERFLIVTGPLAPRVYTTVKDSGVMLTLRFLCAVDKRRANDEIAWEAILDAFAARDDIDLAYPTTRYFDNRSEGKPGHKPAP